eukprot:TRINITY_DN1111_c0_g1_i1.p1 TRINITY_DN1111_c0_g1~~TRINITY_DN1111_c0_g1_i1.p1  ORF type:complete len:816 (+),score=194.73 TRINITY_DN1111_c0_g1_i1:93-2540(+)
MILSLDRLRGLMDEANNIRNIITIAHVDHGRHTLSDNLIAFAGISLRDENSHPCLSSQYPLYFEVPQADQVPANSRGRSFLIHLLNPTSSDYSSEITPDLRLADGGVMMVDAVEGVAVASDMVFRLALTQRIKPVLTINKIDRMFFELQLDMEDMYQSFARIVGNINVILATYQDGDRHLSPIAGTVAFSSGLQGWGFTLSTFARIYAEKFEVDETKLIERLWGDWYFDQDAKRWGSDPTSTSGAKLARSFCKFVLEPIYAILRACMDDDINKLNRYLYITKVHLTLEDRDLKGKQLFKCFMQKWLPLNHTILHMAILHLPSPIEAQQYRVEHLYTGPMDDATAIAIRACDPMGPLSVYISKMVPMRSRSELYAYGRVFSGTIRVGQKIRILGNSYQPGSKEFFVKNIPRLGVPMGGNFLEIPSIPAGSTCAIFGIQSFMSKTSTLTSEEHSFPMETSLFTLSSAVKIAVTCLTPGDMPRLIEVLKQLSKSDPLIHVTMEETGEIVISGVNELHLQVTIRDLEQDAGIELVVSSPIVSYRETVIEESDRMCMAMSPNKHNRVYVTAAPMASELVDAIDAGKIVMDDVDIRGQKLVQEFGWDLADTKKIWSFGPNANGPNVMVDITHGVNYLEEIKDSVCAAYQWASNEGVLAGENMRGIRFNIHDVVLHSDAIHRGGGQIIPTSRRALYAAQLTAHPRLMEPIYKVVIQCPMKVLGEVYSTIVMKRGIIIDEVPRIGTPLTMVTSYLPVKDSFGFVSELRSRTSGQAFPEMGFSHWKVMEGDPLMEGDEQFQIVEDIRKRKGMSAPMLNRYLDTL